MQGCTTNHVNLIADNLRERYDNGFPILEEQRHLRFGSLPVFAGAGSGPTPADRLVTLKSLPVRSRGPQAGSCASRGSRTSPKPDR